MSAVTFGVPSAPGQPTLTQASGSTEVVATWTAPTSSNGAALDSYSVEVLKKDGTTYAVIDADCTEYVTTKIPSSALTCTVTMTEIITAATYIAADAGTYIKM